MLYLFQVYALAIMLVLVPVVMLYMLTALSRTAIAAVRDLGRGMQRIWERQKNHQDLPRPFSTGRSNA